VAAVLQILKAYTAQNPQIINTDKTSIQNKIITCVIKALNIKLLSKIFESNSFVLFEKQMIYILLKSAFSPVSAKIRTKTPKHCISSWDYCGTNSLDLRHISH